MLSTIGRAAVRRVVAGRPQSTNRAFYNIWQFQRAIVGKDADNIFTYGRSYTTATKAAAKPKSKTSTTTKAKSSATPRAKKASTKKPTKVAAKKPLKKPVKKKLTKPKKIVTPEEKERKVIKTLKEEALIIPKKKPDTVWKVFLDEQLQKAKDTSGSIVQKMPLIQQAYKEITPADIESLNHTANQNKSDNDVVFKEWVESHTPEVINRANNARALLTKKYNKKRFLTISDSRIPKRPTQARFFFIKERYATGDLKGIDFTEASKLIHREWDALSPSERKVYEDRHAEDQARYIQEYKTVYHKDPKIKTLKHT